MLAQMLGQTWTPPNNLIPGDCEYFGNGTVITAANPDTEFVTIGPRTVLRNVAIHDAFGCDPLVMRNAPNGPRSVTYFENASNVPVISTHWHGMASYIVGGQAGVDSPTSAIKQFGQWCAAKFLEIYQDAYGLHVWALDRAKAILIQSWSSSPQVFLQTYVPTDHDVVIVSGAKTQGDWLALYHGASNFRGIGQTMNFGNSGGTFEGKFVSYMLNGVEQFGVTHDGQVTGPLADRLAAIERRLETMA